MNENAKMISAGAMVILGIGSLFHSAITHSSVTLYGGCLFLIVAGFLSWDLDQ